MDDASLEASIVYLGLFDFRGVSMRQRLDEARTIDEESFMARVSDWTIHRKQRSDYQYCSPNEVRKVWIG